jgi:hypothetical protein
MSKLTAAIKAHDIPNTPDAPGAPNAPDAPNDSIQYDTDVERLFCEKIPDSDSRKEVSEEEEPPLNPNIVDFDGPDDPENPLNWSTARKARSIVIVSLVALLS